MRLSGILVGVRFSHPLLLETLESLVNQGFPVFFVLPGNSHLTLYVTPEVRLRLCRLFSGFFLYHLRCHNDNISL